jgi:capsular polysaccharide biosynthesis protein
VLTAAIAAGAAYFFSQQMAPVYRGSQQVLIVPSRTDNGLALATTRLLNSRIAYLVSELRATEIIDRLQLDMQPGFLLSRTNIASNADSLLIQIDVEMTDPSLAMAIAQEWGNLLVRYQDDLNQQARQEDRVNASLQDNPRAAQSSPNVAVNTAVGAILGAVLGGVIVFVLETLESRLIQKPDDIERQAGLPIMALVPGAD